MAGEVRARADQYARRVRSAQKLLASGAGTVEAARQLARRYRVSERQARRYVDRARAGGPVDVPRPKIVFTVKLPVDLARQVRQQARRTGQSLSGMVAAALREFLERLGANPRDG
jgi:DNA-binding transcriptional regulator LsrR (DeoR family)